MLPAGVQLGLGVRAAAVSMQIAQGTVAETGGALDLAIEGQGYLEITLPNGDPAYTRDGALKRNGDGLVVTSDGYSVVPDITIPEDARADHDQRRRRGLRLLRRPDRGAAARPVQPRHASRTRRASRRSARTSTCETEASGAANVGAAGEDGRGTFRQGYLENSSVDAVREITGLIEAQRGYELNAKVITAADQMLAATTQIR